jgi:hypothetical protein
MEDSTKSFNTFLSEDPVPTAQKKKAFSLCYTCKYRPQRSEMTTDFISGFITNSFRLIFVPNKTEIKPNEKPFLDSMC